MTHAATGLDQSLAPPLVAPDAAPVSRVVCVPVELRRTLAADRRRGARFDDSWPIRVAEVLAAVGPPDERHEWATVLDEQTDLWRSGYERRLRSGRPLSIDLLAEVA